VGPRPPQHPGITGDPPKLGNYPHASAVFDVDAIGLVNLINRLNHGLDWPATPSASRPGSASGGREPGRHQPRRELRRLDWKIEAAPST